MPGSAGRPEDAACLDELKEDLVARRGRAEREGWLGEIEGINLTLASCG
jgi:hypothetical protein